MSLLDSAKLPSLKEKILAEAEAVREKAEKADEKKYLIIKKKTNKN